MLEPMSKRRRLTPRNFRKAALIFSIWINLSATVSQRSSSSISLLVVGVAELGQSTTLLCVYETRSQEDRLQYIAWTKIDQEGLRQFVYDYDPCAGSDRAYNSLEGRALLNVTQTPPDYDDYQLRSGGDETGADDALGKLRKIQAVLVIAETRMEDAGRFECHVKLINGPAVSASYDLGFTELPSRTAIVEAVSNNLTEGETLRLKCRANVGRPAGILTWLHRRPTSSDKSQGIFVPIDDVSTTYIMYANGTTLASSDVTIDLTSDSHGDEYVCVTSSLDDVIGSMDEQLRPSDRVIKLNISFGAKDIAVEYNTSMQAYICKSRGNPEPQYTWFQMFSNGHNISVGNDSVLNVSQLSLDGDVYHVRCVASNIIDGMTRILPIDLNLTLADVANERNGQNFADSAIKPISSLVVIIKSAFQNSTQQGLYSVTTEDTQSNPPATKLASSSTPSTSQHTQVIPNSEISTPGNNIKSTPEPTLSHALETTVSESLTRQAILVPTPETVTPTSEASQSTTPSSTVITQSSVTSPSLALLLKSSAITASKSSLESEAPIQDDTLTSANTLTSAQNSSITLSTGESLQAARSVTPSSAAEVNHITGTSLRSSILQSVHCDKDGRGQKTPVTSSAGTTTTPTTMTETTTPTTTPTTTKTTEAVTTAAAAATTTTTTTTATTVATITSKTVASVVDQSLQLPSPVLSRNLLTSYLRWSALIGRNNGRNIAQSGHREVELRTTVKQPRQTTYATLFNKMQPSASYDYEDNIPEDSYLSDGQDEEIPIWNVGQDIQPFLDSDVNDKTVVGHDSYYGVSIHETTTVSKNISSVVDCKNSSDPNCKKGITDPQLTIQIADPVTDPVTDPAADPAADSAADPVAPRTQNVGGAGVGIWSASRGGWGGGAGLFYNGNDDDNEYYDAAVDVFRRKKYRAEKRKQNRKGKYLARQRERWRKYLTITSTTTQSPYDRRSYYYPFELRHYQDQLNSQSTEFDDGQERYYVRNHY